MSGQVWGGGTYPVNYQHFLVLGNQSLSSQSYIVEVTEGPANSDEVIN